MPQIEPKPARRWHRSTPRAKTQEGRPTKITSAADASIVKGMCVRGDPVHDIAAWFGVNSGRISNVKNARCEGRQFKDVPPAPAHALPPVGPYSYFTARPGMSLEQQVQQALAKLELKWAQALSAEREERRQTNEKLDHVLRQLANFGRELKLIDGSAPKPSRRTPQAG